MGIPDHLTCFLRNPYAGQEATVRTGHGTTDWFQILVTFVNGLSQLMAMPQREIREINTLAPFPSPVDHILSVFIPIPNKGNAKECSNYHTIALISHASKLILKILQARLQQYVNRELPDVQAGFRKGRGTRDQIANISSL